MSLCGGGQEKKLLALQSRYREGHRERAGWWLGDCLLGQVSIVTFTENGVCWLVFVTLTHASII